MRARVGVGSRGGKTARGQGDLLAETAAEGALVVFDGQQVVGAVLQDQVPGGLGLGVKRVQSHPPVGQIQPAEEFARHRDFIGLGVDQGAAQVELTGHGDGAQQGVARTVAGLFAIDHDQVAGRQLSEGSNEIPAAQALMRRLDLEGSLVTADAMHTQTETARIIVQDRGGDYLVTVKGNQKGVAANVQQLHQELLGDFFPSA